MHKTVVMASILLLIVQCSPALAGKIYRWLDKQGQVHFGDIAPAGTMPPVSILQPDPSGKSGAVGLRPAEMELLMQVEQRSQQQALRARNRRLKNNSKRAEQREHCDVNREKLHGSTGEKTYKQYSKYLRNHCW